MTLNQRTPHYSVAVILSVAMLWSVCSSAQSSSRDLHRKVVVHLLNAERGFPTKKQLLRTGKIAATNKILTEIAIDRKVKTRLRLNAVRALEHFPTRRTNEVLMSVLYAKKQKPAYMSACLRSLARAFGVHMYFEILPFLNDLNTRVREGAAIALGEVDDERVKGILMNHLSNEKEIEVRLALEKALKRVLEREKVKQKRIRMRHEKEG